MKIFKGILQFYRSNHHLIIIPSIYISKEYKEINWLYYVLSYSNYKD
jgi:hypothetical protein